MIAVDVKRIINYALAEGAGGETLPRPKIRDCQTGRRDPLAARQGIEMTQCWIVVQDTGGAHEPAGAWSVWTTPTAALADALRLNRAFSIRPYGAAYGSYEIAKASMDGPCGSGGFYVVRVDVDVARENNIE